MKILLIEPYYTGSHKQWADGYKKHSSHEIRILSMKGQFWKWRMHGGAVTMAIEFNKMNWSPDLILTTDMLDLTTFLSLTRKKTDNIQTIIYFHENQISYPWSPNDRDIKQKRDSHYGFINYSSALASDRILFNSSFHMNSFLNSLPIFLRQFPDYQELDTINSIRNKAKVLYLGMDLKIFDRYKSSHKGVPLILWNHRWEYDKNPELFFKVLNQIKDDGYNYGLIVLGENFSQSPTIFEKSKETLKDKIVHWGYAKSFDEYAKWLWMADILPVTSNQDFFGASVMEAIYCDTWPILPNSLTYPELIPQKHHPDVLYKSENELYKKVCNALKSNNISKRTTLHTIAQKFDWSKMAPLYDKILGNRDMNI